MRTPETVYSTRTSDCFHEDRGCWGLRAGQSSADARGANVAPIEEFPISDVPPHLKRCQVCATNR